MRERELLRAFYDSVARRILFLNVSIERILIKDQFIVQKHANEIFKNSFILYYY